MTPSLTFIWLVIIVLLIVIELMTMALTTIWFVGGAIIACILAALQLPLWLQIVAFVLVSVALLYFTRPIAVKYFNKNRSKTNVEGLIDKEAIVTADIDNLLGTGQVKVQGMEWTARSLDGSNISAGEVVVIKAVEGVKLIVEIA